MVHQNLTDAKSGWATQGRRMPFCPTQIEALTFGFGNDLQNIECWIKAQCVYARLCVLAII